MKNSAHTPKLYKRLQTYFAAMGLCFAVMAGRAEAAATLNADLQFDIPWIVYENEAAETSVWWLKLHHAPMPGKDLLCEVDEFGNPDTAVSPQGTDVVTLSTDLHLRIPKLTFLGDNSLWQIEMEFIPDDNKLLFDITDYGLIQQPAVEQDRNRILFGQFGQLSAAEVKFFSLPDVEILSAITDADGYFDFSLPGIDPGKIILVKVSGGEDTDANGNGIPDAVPAPNHGTVYALATAAHLQQDKIIVSQISDIAWRYTENFIGNASAETIFPRLKVIAEAVFIEDITGDGILDINDLLRFNPVDSTHMQALKDFDYQELLGSAAAEGLSLQDAYRAGDDVAIAGVYDNFFSDKLIRHPGMVTTPAKLAAVPDITEEEEGKSMIRLSWEAVETAAKYTIYWQEAGETEQTKTIEETAYSHIGLKNGVTYSYRITAVAVDGTESAISQTVSAIPMEIFRDAPATGGGQGPAMVRIPAGTFRMGDIQGGGQSDERPVHKVSVSAFDMGRYEVSNIEYAVFLNAVGHRGSVDQPWFHTQDEDPESHITGAIGGFAAEADYENHPVIGVSWYGAAAYAEWLSAWTGHRYRLPSEAEWEYAARAGTETKYWLGDDIGVDQANCADCGDNRDKTAPVNAFTAANSFGLLGMAGNAAEWVQDWYSYDYYTISPDTDPQGPMTSSIKGLRGGSWNDGQHNLRSANRSGYSPNGRANTNGFRVVRGEIPLLPTDSPANLAATAGDRQVSLTWDAVSDAKYIIYWRKNGGAEQFALSVAAAYTHTGLSNDSEYVYRVTATAAGRQQSAPSASIVAVPVAAAPDPGTLASPANLAATAGNGQVILTWDATADAEGYIIYWRENGGAEQSINSTAAGYTHSGLNNGSEYSYRVTATASSMPESASSAAVSANPAAPDPGTLDSPANLAATAGDGQVSLTWDATVGAEGYLIYWQENGGAEQSISSAAAGYTHTGLNNGSEYSYRVTATAAGMAESVSSATVSANPAASSTGTLDSPANLSAAAGDGQVILTWDATAGAEEYLIYWQENGGAEQSISSAAAGYTHTGLNNGSEYSYRVTATAAGMAESASSAAVSANPAAATLDSPANLAATPGDGQVILTWDATAGAEGYLVYWQESGGAEQSISNVAAGYTHTGLNNGSEYSYRVTATAAGMPESDPSATVSATPAIPTPGDAFHDTLANGSPGPEMVMIPGSAFRMGDIQGGGSANELPVHEAMVNSFAMGRYEITNAEYVTFLNTVNQRGSAEEPWFQDENSFSHISGSTGNFAVETGYEDHPMNIVSWYGAVAYAEWLSVQTGHSYRLPAAAEWEYAARARTETKYWWGDDIGENRANCYGTTPCTEPWDKTSPVGSFAANFYGLYDTAGNVWEWVQDWYSADYYASSPVCNPQSPDSGTERVLRGGSSAWNNSYPANLRAAYRYKKMPSYFFGDIGFRVARDEATPAAASVPKISIEVLRDPLADGGQGPELVKMPARTFRMGNIQGGGQSNELPVHEVTVSDFAMGRYEVTYAEFTLFLNSVNQRGPDGRPWFYTKDENSSSRITGQTGNFTVESGYENYPMEGISWFGATAYADWLSAQTGYNYRLPSEAEWEYAAGAGTETKYWWGNDAVDNMANCNNAYCSDSWLGTAPVGSFDANPFGVYDTAGNVREWVQDWYSSAYYADSPLCDPQGPESSAYRVYRGGGANNYLTNLRTASRGQIAATNRSFGTGFRIMRRAN
ncbi:MAG: SUMF1/EgtB/PvdO family nonheme iron enzyme [Gammaproteobacteria bacterium]|nr:SUMF1/EgtB/PvdO family nonheme iron enzyme [Gammaproteobacteria bacterium]